MTNPIQMEPGQREIARCDVSKAFADTSFQVFVSKSKQVIFRTYDHVSETTGLAVRFETEAEAMAFFDEQIVKIGQTLAEKAQATAQSN